MKHNSQNVGRFAEALSTREIKRRVEQLKKTKVVMELFGYLTELTLRSQAKIK
jgi:hypothetical protein